MAASFQQRSMAGLLRAAVLFPWWALALATGSKSFRDNPIIGSKWLNRLGLHDARISMAHRLAWWRRKRLAHEVLAEDRRQLTEQGYVLVPDFLAPERFERLRAALLGHAAPAREMVQGDAITRRIAIDPALLRAVPELRDLLDEPRWGGLMRYVASFDVEPLYYIQTILAHHVAAPPDPQTALHADTFHPTMKAWFFLNDVHEDDGPLTYVPGSHRLTSSRRAWERRKAVAAPEGLDHLSSRGSLRIQRDELAALELPDPVAFAVPANTLVVVDTVGFHARALAKRPSVRVEIWAYSRRNPFLPWVGWDVLSLPGLAERRIGWLWRARDALRRCVGQPWTAVGDKYPTQRDS